MNRIEELDLCTGQWISGRRPCSFVQIAPDARESQVVGQGSATSGSWDDVLDGKTGALKALMHEAVLATLVCTRADLARQRVGYGHLRTLAKNLQGLPADERQLFAQFDQGL
jgi:hypothetical protein